jgi:flagellar protein FliL
MAGAAAALGSGAEPLAGPKQRGGKRKLIALGAPVLAVALGAGLWFSGVLPRLLGHGDAHSETRAEAQPAAPVFFELPEMVANLNGNTRRPSYLKLQVKLELARKEDAAVVQAAMPRLLDLFQTYLREMRPEELRGSAGTHRLREELIARANLAVAPARITDVLFTEMLVQ